MRALPARSFKVATSAGFASLAFTMSSGGALSSAAARAESDGGHAPLTATTIVSGHSLTHSFTPSGSPAPTSPATAEPLSKPDDLTRLGDHLFVGFQNGVGPQGEPSESGNLDGTVVELTMTGQVLNQWDVAGKIDGLTADPAPHTIVVTTNEDGNSSLSTITPRTVPAVQHYAYNEPLPHNGGTDAITILHGQILVTASAPGTTGAPAPQPNYPAVYSVSLDKSTSVATVSPRFNDEDPATVANVGAPGQGQTANLGLTDPDSSEVVPSDAPRFGGDFMLTSQGDQVQIFVDRDHASSPKLSELQLSQAVDDTAWPSGGNGTLFATDSTNDTVDAVTGSFGDQPVVAATPCGSNSAPPTCPAPPLFPINYLGSLNPWTGKVTPLTVGGVAFVPQGGLLFASHGDARPEGQNQD